MNYIIDHIPRSTPCNRRPGLPMIAETITIHNTGNPSSSAANERAWLTNPINDRQASYHLVVDEYSTIECIPFDENAWHAGDGNGDGNRKSISIEICESGDYAKAMENAIELTAKLLKERGWGIDRLRRHWDWSGKVCPRLMYSGGTWSGWYDFNAAVVAKLEDEDEMNKLMEYDQWAWDELNRYLGDAYNDDIITDWKWVQAALDKTLTYSDLLLLKVLIDERRRKEA